GASLAILGRLLMAEEKWGAAADAYKAIIEADVYTIDPEFLSLFQLGNGSGKEVILSSQYKEDVYGHVLPQYLYPETWGGWNQFAPYMELVNTFECLEGKSIVQSPL